MHMKRCTVRLVIAIGVLASWGPSLPVSADVLIESYRDGRPADADRILGPIRDELDKAGVKSRPIDVIAGAGDQLPLSGVADPDIGPSYPADPASQVELGTTQVFRGDYDAGLTTLESLLKAAQQNPGLVVADTSSFAWLTKAYAAVAFAHLRKHHLEAATEAVAEQIRSIPESPIGRIVGPDIAALADTVHKTLDGSPHGTLRVSVSRPDVQIFLDEHAPILGKSFLKLPNGAYRLVLVRAGISRRYPAVVVADRTTDLSIDWDADEAFTATAQWIGFVWSRGQDDKTDVAVARYTHGAARHDILVVGIVEQSARRFLAGKIFEKKTGALVRHKAIELGRDDDRCGRALAQYLLNGTSSSCLVDDPSEPVHTDKPGHTHHDPYLVSGIVAGAGAVSLIGGVAVLAAKQDPSDGRGGPTYLNVPGVGLLVAGGLAIGAAAYLASRASGNPEDGNATLRHSHAPLYVSAATAVAAFAVGGYLLHLDGKGTCGLGGAACYYRYNSAPYGWTLLGAGAAAAGFGVYWQLRTPGDSQAPSVSLTPTATGAMAGIGGSF